MNSFNKLNCKKYSLLLLVLFFSAPSTASVCFTQISLQMYESNFLFDDFNKDGVTDKYEISPDGSLFHTFSVISLSKDGQEFSNIYEIDESWALNNETQPSDNGIPTNLISFDVNNDGFNDIAAAFGAQIIIRINDKNGDFTTGMEQFLNMSDLYGIEESLVSEKQAQYDAKLFALDLNKNGYEDLVIFHAEGISIFLNDTSGYFYHLKNINLSGLIDKEVFVNIFDLDDDSLPEIIVNVRNSNATYVIYFSESASVDIVTITSLLDYLNPIDIDNDGDLDFEEKFLIPIYCSENYRLDSEVASYWLNNGNGLFNRVVESKPNPMIGSITPATNNDESGGGSISLQYFLTLFILLLTRNLILRTGWLLPQKKI